MHNRSSTRKISEGPRLVKLTPTTVEMSRKNKKPMKRCCFYAVARGRQIGLFDKWADCSTNVKGFSSALYKKFEYKRDAEDWLEKSASSAKKHKKDSALVIYIDGACSGNPGPAGIGVWFGPEDPRNLSESLDGNKQTNQRAELTALIRCLEIAPKEEPLHIYSDSEYCVYGRMKKRKANLDLWNRLDALWREDIVLEHVRGHQGVFGNEMADQLATSAIKNVTKK